MLKRDQRFLTNPQTLNWFKKFASDRNGPFVDIGSGKGALLFCLPFPRTGFEKDPSFAQFLENETIIWGDWLYSGEIYDARTVVANLPFSNSISHIIQIYQRFPSLEVAAIVVEKNVADCILSKGRLGFLMRCLFRSQRIKDLPGTYFSPSVNVTATILQLTPLKKEIIQNRKIFFQLKKLTSVRKFLSYTFPTIPSSLGKKRLDQLSSEEELQFKSYLINLK